MNPNELKKAQEAIQREEERLKKIRNRKVEWSIPGEKQEYIRDYKREHRRRMLDLLAPERRCPICSCIKLKSRQWVILESWKLDKNKMTQRALERLREEPLLQLSKIAVCRSCTMKELRAWET